MTYNKTLTSLELLGHLVEVYEITTLIGRFGFTVISPNGHVVDNNVCWSPLGAAREARLEVLASSGALLWEVSLWCSRPGTNDDCNTAETFETEAEARACYGDPSGVFSAQELRSAAWFALCTMPERRVSEEVEARCNPDYDAARALRDEAAYDEMCRQEMAMQAGMAFGCDGYNDAMGW